MQRPTKIIKSSKDYLRKIKYLKNIFIAIMFFLSIYLLINMVLNESKEKALYNDNNQNNTSNSKYKISNFIFTQAFGIAKEYKFFASKYTELSNIGVVDQPILHLFDNHHLDTIINAEQGILSSERQKLKLKNKIELIYQENLKLFNDEAEIDLKTMEATSDKFTKIIWNKSYLNSPKGFVVNSKDKTATLFGVITGKYYDQNDKEISFEGQILKIYNNGNNIALENEVKVFMEDQKLTTHKLLFDRNKNIIHLIGNTRLITTQEDITAKAGYIDLATKKLYLNDNVVIKKQNSAVVKGQKFVYDYNNHESSMVGGYNKSNRVQILINK